MSLDDFSPPSPELKDLEILNEMHKLAPHTYGATVDMWKLHETIERNEGDLWWSSVCGIAGCGHPAWQLDARGYRCYFHRGESA